MKVQTTSRFLFLFIFCFTFLLSLCHVIGSSTSKSKTKTKTKTFISKFITGRIPPGKFEYSKLNGFYRPNVAAKICERDLGCAGFTFKGSPINIKRNYEIFFFHFVPKDIFDVNKKQYYHWTIYQVFSRKEVHLKNVKISLNKSSEVCLPKLKYVLNYY